MGKNIGVGVGLVDFIMIVSGVNGGVRMDDKLYDEECVDCLYYDRENDVCELENNCIYNNKN